MNAHDRPKVSRRSDALPTIATTSTTRAGRLQVMRVNKKGRVFEAHVLTKRKGELEIEPIQRGITYTTASAREMICHWAKRGRPRRRAPGAEGLPLGRTGV